MCSVPKFFLRLMWEDSKREDPLKALHPRNEIDRLHV